MEGWVTKSISDVISKTKTIDPRKSPESEFMYVDVSGVSNKTLEIIESTKLSGKDAPSRARRVITKGDILFATVRPTLRRIAIVPSELDGEVCSTGYFVFQPTPELYNRYLFYFLQSDNFMGEMEKLQKGASYPAVNDSQVKSRLISYPPFPEQKRIVALLDTVFADLEQTRVKTEQNLKNARELFDSYLQQVFSQKGDGWVDEKMSAVCEGTITDGTHQTPKYFDEGYIFLSSKNVTSGFIDWDNVKYLDEVQHVKMQKRLSPQLNDILLAKNGTTGVAAIVDRDVIFDIYVSLALLRPSERILPRYLLHFVNSPLAKAQFNKRLKGIGVPNLHLKEIRDVIVSLPESTSEQQDIVTKIDALLVERDKLVTIYQEKLDSIDELKKSILQKAFNGELTNAVA